MRAVDEYIGGRVRQLAFYQYPPVVEEVDLIFIQFSLQEITAELHSAFYACRGQDVHVGHLVL